MGFFRGPNIVRDGLVLALDAGAVRSYPGSGTTVYDLIGSNSGTLANGVGFQTNVGGDWSFDGTNDYINISGLDSSFQISQGTIEAWIKPSSDGTDQMVCGLGGGGTTGATRVIRILSNQWGYVGYGSTNEDWSSIASVTFNTWAHVLIGWNGTSLTFWLNGTQYTATRTGIVTPNSSVIRLGVSPWSTTNRPFEGNIANFKFYNTLLSTQEVLQNYNAQKSRFGL